MEIFTSLDANKAIIFRGAAVKAVTDRGAVLAGGGGGGGGGEGGGGSGGGGRAGDFGSHKNKEAAARRERERIAVMLQECAFIVNVEQAQCAVAQDRLRELLAIARASEARGGLRFVNKALAAALNTGAVSAQQGIVEVDNYLCGEPEGLRTLTFTKVEPAVNTVCAQGLVEVLDELLLLGRVQGEGATVGSDGGAVAAEVARTVTSNYYALWIASNNGREGIVARLLEVEGLDVNLGHPDDACSPLYVACEKGHEGVVQLLLAQDAIDVNKATTTDGRAPLHVACQNGHENVVRLLLAQDAVNVNQTLTTDGATPLFIACSKGHRGVVELLLDKSETDANQSCDDDSTPLFIACSKGNDEVVEVLLERDVDESAMVSGWTPIAIAEAQGHVSTAAILRRAEAERRRQQRGWCC